MLLQELVHMEREGAVFLKHEIRYRSLCGKSKKAHDALRLTLFQMCALRSCSAGLGFAPVVDSTCVTHV